MDRRGLRLRKAFLNAILPMLRALPPGLACGVVTGLGRVEYTLRPDIRRRIEAGLSRGEDYFACHWNRSTVGPELAGNQVRWRTRDRLLDGLSDARVAPLFAVQGREHLDAALGEGRGVILLCSHFGSHMMPAHWLTRQGLPLRLYMERPRSISKFLAKQFDSDGPLGQRKLFISRKTNPKESAGSVLRAAKMLKAGTIVMIAGDVRWSGQHTAPARFLGRDYTFSATWVHLAALTGSPVVPVFCRMDRAGTHQLEFLPSYHVPSDAPAQGQVASWVQSCLDTIEQQVQADPANSNDYFFWEGQEIGSAA